MSVSKKLRFEVFKRDKFTCQYCGRKAPDVILECDHIQPKSKDGTDDLLNLTTSCYDCNRGKGPRELSDDSVVVKQRTQLEDLQERQEQIEMMIDWQRGLRNLDRTARDRAAEYWSELLDEHYSLTEIGLSNLTRLLKKYELALVLDAMRVSVDAYIRYDDEGRPTKESVEYSLGKIGGICYNQKRWGADPEAETVDRAWWAFRKAYRYHSEHPPDWRLREWFAKHLEPAIRNQYTTDQAIEWVGRVVQEGVNHYHDSNHGGYWAALRDCWKGEAA